MAGIGAALEAGYNVILGGQHVDHLSFSFIAPLEPQQDVYFSFVHYLLLFCFVCFFVFFCLVSLAWHVEQMP